MNIEEFVTNVLIDLDRAVNNARSETARDISFTQTADSRTVEFDIAVSAETLDEASGKAGVRVLSVVEAGGDLKQSNKNSTVSRVKFGVHIEPLTREENEQRAAEFREASARRRANLNARLNNRY